MLRARAAHELCPHEPPLARSRRPGTAVRLPALILDDVARLLAEEAGVSLRDGLDLRLVDGLDGAARAAGEPIRAFARRVLARERDAIEALVEHVVVSETAFWRHPEQLAAVGRLAAAAEGPLSVWSAGCATGEEAYSVAITLLEAGRAGRGDRILATDVSERALGCGSSRRSSPRAGSRARRSAASVPGRVGSSRSPATTSSARSPRREARSISSSAGTSSSTSTREPRPRSSAGSPRRSRPAARSPSDRSSCRSPRRRGSSPWRTAARRCSVAGPRTRGRIARCSTRSCTRARSARETSPT